MRLIPLIFIVCLLAGCAVRPFKQTTFYLGVPSAFVQTRVLNALSTVPTVTQ